MTPVRPTRPLPSCPRPRRRPRHPPPATTPLAPRVLLVAMLTASLAATAASPQTSRRIDGSHLPPRKGGQVEAGLRVSLSVGNLFDKRYIDRPAAGGRQSYFGGEPRNATLALSCRL